jgi:3-hydroxybutyryl-CoA dehydrogenase
VEINNIFVIGAGTMGSGIAQTAAVAGYQVTMMDVVPEQLALAKAAIAKSVDKLAAKGMLDEQQSVGIDQITYVENFENVPGADFVIEAATENPELKLIL